MPSLRVPEGAQALHPLLARERGLVASLEALDQARLVAHQGLAQRRVLGIGGIEEVVSLGPVAGLIESAQLMEPVLITCRHSYWLPMVR